MNRQHVFLELDVQPVGADYTVTPSLWTSPSAGGTNSELVAWLRCQA
jgi:hypothetical protein